MSHETRTSPPTYPEVLDIHDGAFSESIWGSDGFRTIKVSGQSDVVADSYKDDLTITAGTNVTITTNASGDSVTIASTPYTAGNGLQLSGNEFSVTALAITSVQEAANQTAHLALTTQQGDVVVRADENKSYVRNAGTAGNMSDFTLLKTPTDLVLSVHGNTGAITANQIAAAVEAATDSNTFTDADHSKLNAIEASATADQTSTEIKSLLASDKLAAGHIADNAIDSDHYVDGSIDHVHLSGDCVDGDNIGNDSINSEHYIDGSIDEQHIANDAVTYAKMQDVSATDRILGRDSSGAGVIEEITPANLRTMINVEDAADVTDTANVTSAGAVMKTTVDAKGDILVASADNTVTKLTAGSNDKVLTADSNEATGLKWATPATPGDANQNAFSTVAVSGQDSVAADTATDTLNLAAGTNVTLTTNASSDTVTIAATDTSKMPLAGGTFTGDVKINDGEEIRVGSDSDLVIVHNGTDGFIKETTGTLDIRAKNTNGGIVSISDSAGENLVKAVAGGTVELTYDGTKKLETTTAGVQIVGQMGSTTMHIPDGSTGIQVGSSNDLKIYHSGSASFIDETGDGALVIRSNNAVDIKSSDDEMMAAFNKDADVKLYHNSSEKFKTTSAGVDITGQMGSDTIHVPNGSTGIQVGDSNDLKIYHDGTNTHIHDDTSATLVITNNDIRFKTSGDETTLRAVANGAVELMHNGSTKLTTTSAGVTVTGGIIAGGLTYPTSDGSNGQVLTTNGSGTLSFSTSSGGISDIVSDTSPQLGGDLDTNSFEILLDDDHNIKFGASNDLTIHHAGAGANKIISASPHTLYIASDQTQITNAGISEACGKFIANGAVELYYDNAKKLSTTANGVKLEGSNLWAPDNVKINIGQGDDLQIYHNGSNSYINNATGALAITGNDLNFENAARDETYIECDNGGAVKLYYDNSKKAFTGSTGFNVDGNCDLVSDNNKLQCGADADLQIYHDGSNNILKNNNCDTYIQPTSNGETAAIFKANGAVELYYDNSKKLETQANGVTVTGGVYSDGLICGDDDKVELGTSGDLQIYHNGTNSVIQNLTGDLYIQGTGGSADDVFIKSVDDIFLQPQDGEAGIDVHGNGNVKLYYDNSEKLATYSGGINVTGYVNLTDSQHLQLGTGNDLQIYHDGTDSIIDNNTGALHLKTNTAISVLVNNSENAIVANANAETKLYYDNSAKFETTSAGAKVTGDLSILDDNKVSIGTDDNLYIKHSNGHGKNFIVSSVGDLEFHMASSELAMKHITNGAVELYYDNVKKLETTSTGVLLPVTGADAKSALQLNGTNGSSETAALIIESDGENGRADFKYNIGNGTPDLNMRFTADATELYYNNVKKFETRSDGVDIHGLAEVNGDVRPNANNTHDLGTSSLRWANLYINDLQLSNEGSQNSVDGTWGDWTLQEGENDIFMLNNRSGKKYKMNLTEVS